LILNFTIISSIKHGKAIIDYHVFNHNGLVFAQISRIFRFVDSLDIYTSFTI